MPVPCVVSLELAPGVYARLGRDPAAEIGRLVDRAVGSCVAGESLAKRLDRLNRDELDVNKAREELGRAAEYVERRRAAVHLGRTRLGISSDVEAYISDLEALADSARNVSKAIEKLEGDRALFRLLANERGSR
jgi:hypothetical protein